ncbi:hypothetical protein CANTEDRAFT_92714 [Yamadazyma tenuis ATCC 10573]|uniref:Uncharacterized protein n=1 Tax=Candida tenuis (strain ATCC 10573 / BCRC 21748 / CBS 615 / JCM 9827 / NBRC 10315 / NRRL Y-1498 / VKM Y-70) TaxID=590646 RepID=G3B1M5_CANTC|nr:uncharacterized protein CANTEDRAFT_92714 [Yamadazyma tenuis ATCC 10573]EGV64484.1 hypothetical protein CANTEDRAFT_92714 [Yamadazyma tenuis ATCC 10573]
MYTDTTMDPNAFYGLPTNYGWFYIPKKLYATDWTLPAVNEKIKQVYPDIESNAPSFQDIQDVIDDWCIEAKMATKPKPTKITKADKEELKHFMLYKSQLKPLMREQNRSKKRLAKEQDMMLRKSQKVQRAKERENAIEYVAKHGKFPEDYDFSQIKLTHAWNHYSAKFYKEAGASGQTKQNLSVQWKEMSKEKKEEYREEYIQHLKEGILYQRGELVPIKEKFKSLRK